ncbi:hypothetical protein EVAR_97495_1 [Eumeta japonica]|uniref:Uncharacterized protein n=1 Tax=Eumeta variegata TaxID=151549 RepID=A0A4C1SYL1_EUMVA|nr:hypothetical protein EVAR_97495_1 [Eumeta japonica]
MSCNHNAEKLLRAVFICVKNEQPPPAARRPPPKPANVIDFFREPFEFDLICLAANHLNLVSSQCAALSQTTPSTRRRKWRPKEVVHGGAPLVKVASPRQALRHYAFGGVYNLLSPRQTSPYLITKARAPRRAVVPRLKFRVEG